MRMTDVVIITICAILGYGIVRNILGPSARNENVIPPEEPPPPRDD